MSYRSIVEWVGGDGSEKEKGSKCGYCKSKDTCFTDDGIWAHWMKPGDYQDLIDRGWRRSGKYLYKPNNQKTCCPMYTIRLGVDRFKCSRTQKRVIAKMNEFLNTGKTSSGLGSAQPESTGQRGAGDGRRLKEINTACIGSIGPDEEQSQPQVEVETPERARTLTPTLQKTPKRHSSTKKRQQRIERRIAKGKPFSRSKDETPPKALIDRLAKGIAIDISDDNKKITLTGRISTLEIKLVKVNSDEEEATMKESYEVYNKYQRDIHNDKDSSMDGWTRFLRKNPFNEKSQMGTYHCQYRLNGALICVGVLDHLTACFSSVYLYSDTAYSNLSLGTYSACVEILLSQLIELPFYYMGYYVHSCQKMRYKGRFKPSELACPETYEWVDLRQCVPLLEKSPYARFNRDANARDPNAIGFTAAQLMQINNRLPCPIVWLDQKVMNWSKYRAVLPVEEKEANEVIRYAQTVGSQMCFSLVLVRQTP